MKNKKLYSYIMIFMTSLLILVGCGSGKSSQEAKELLDRILTLVGIPQEIVVNICQDENNNGLCESFEVHAKIRLNRGDSVDSILQKIKFQADGTYLLHHHDPTKKILMEIEDNEKLKNTGQRVTLSYLPLTQELSILQSLIDNNFIKESDSKAIKESKDRPLIDAILLENLFRNQTLLEEQNMSVQNATIKNLEYIAQGLLDLNISNGELTRRLSSCENNDTCKKNIINEIDTQTEITKRKAIEIADENLSRTHTEETKTIEKGAADGYIISLKSPAKIICADGSIYSSSLSVRAKGKIKFDSAVANKDCNITVPADAIIDSDNNGTLSLSDKKLSFQMTAPADATYISPLTTLLQRKVAKGENVTLFRKLVKDFNPVSASSTIANGGNLQMEKLLILNQLLKSSMRYNANTDISKVNISSIMSSSPLVSLDVNYLLSTLPSDTAGVITNDVLNMKDLAGILKDINSSKINIESLVINISDGGTTVEEAITNSLKVTMPKSANIFRFTVKKTSDVDAVAEVLSGISNRIRRVYPTAVAGVNRTVTEGTPIKLDGRKSSASLRIVEYRWEDNGRTLSLLPFFTTTLGVGKHVITLTVTDNNRNQNSDTIVVVVKSTASPTSTPTQTPNPIPESDYFISKWKTDNEGSSESNQVKIPTYKAQQPAIAKRDNNIALLVAEPTYDYNYTIDWGDGNINDNVSADITHTYSTQGTYTIKISGKFPRLYNQGTNTDAKKLISIEKWGAIEWKSMSYAFSGCSNLVINATDKPNLSSVTDMSFMFEGATSFNQNIGDWNVSTITNMSYMFSGANKFNQNIGNWDVSNVTDMSYMFNNATSFDQNISDWNVSKVTNMDYMFSNVTLSINNYDALLNGWYSLPSLQYNVTFDAGNSISSQSGDGNKINIKERYSWTIYDYSNPR